MRTLSGPTTTATAGPRTLPGYFVEILFSNPFRVTSRGTIAAPITWNGATWINWDVRVAGLAADASQSALSGSITFGNTDYSLSATILNEGIADRAINIWKFYGDSPGTSDPVQLFAGVGADVSTEPKRNAITITLQQAGGKTGFTPRRYITKENGFSILPPEGKVISWNGENITLRQSNA